jgi:hypothetical protein
MGWWERFSVMILRVDLDYSQIGLNKKTPTTEIEKALKIKTECFIEKIKSKGHGNKK